MTKKFTYDEVPYPSYIFPQTSPDRLATIATLFGVAAAPPGSSRVLEIGCGDGSNLLSHAFLFPGSRFFGFDLSAVQIDAARRSAAELKLSNIEFEKIDILDFSIDAFGEFDYIIAHGVFSWVPAAVRTKILEIYSRSLSPNGIGYISYNTFPGCHIRQMVWDMMRLGSRDRQNAAEQIDAGREILSFITGSMPEDGLYKKLFEKELANVSARSAENVLHDDLSETNQPFYFNEFVELIEPFGLKYLADSDPVFLGRRNISPEAARQIDDMTAAPILREAYRDFVELTRFRTSLVCRSGVTLFDEPSGDALDRLTISSPVEPVNSPCKVSGESAEAFRGPKGGTFEINHPLTKAALSRLHSVWPRSLSFIELTAESSELLGTAASAGDGKDARMTRNFLLELFKNGFIALHAHRHEFCTDISVRPEASRFARWQIDRGFSFVTTTAGVNINVEIELVRELIRLLDGTRSIEQITGDVAKVVSVPFSQRQTFYDELPAVVVANLEQMARIGLLI